MDVRREELKLLVQGDDTALFSFDDEIVLKIIEKLNKCGLKFKPE
jgi:DNA-binding LacI/PurR family transcriptional regulator